MVVTTRRSQDVQLNASSDPPGSMSYPLPSYKPESSQTKANDKQLRYLLAVYESLAEDGQVPLASRMTGLSESWIRRWMYREKRNRKRRKRPLSQTPGPVLSASSTTSSTSSSPFPGAGPLLVQDQRPLHPQFFPGHPFINHYFQPNPHASYPSSSLSSSSMLSMNAPSRPTSAPEGFLSVHPGYLEHPQTEDPALIRSMTRSPSLGYIPSVFPCGPPADAQIQNAHQAQNLPANANPATSVEQSDTSTPALVPSLTSSTLPSVPSLDLLSVLNDPAAADALTVDPSQPNYAHLCQLFQEATAFNPALSDPQAYPYAHPGPSEYHYQVPVSIPTSYEALLTTVSHTSSQKPHTNINVTNHSSDTIHNRSRTVSGSTSHPFNMSFAPSLQSHSTSVHPAASLGPGASDKSTSVPAFSLAALHGYSQNVWNAQRLQALAFGTKRIHATDPPGAAASTVEGDTSTSTSAYCHGETSVSSDTNLSPSLNEESYFTINTSGMSESHLVSQGGEEEEEESDSGE